MVVGGHPLAPTTRVASRVTAESRETPFTLLDLRFVGHPEVNLMRVVDEIRRYRRRAGINRHIGVSSETLFAPSRNRRSREPYNRINREIGDWREGGGGVRSSGEAEQCLWSEGTLLFVTAPTIGEARAK
jgi:hypothetical protein